MQNEKGRRAEWELRDVLRMKGYVVMRGAGSHTIDLLAIAESGRVMALEVKCTSKSVLSLSGAYLREQLANMLALSRRIPSYYTVKFPTGWEWFEVRDGMGTVLRPYEGMTLEQVEGYR